VIEPAGADEADALALVHASAFETPWTTVELQQLMQNPAVFVLAARQDGLCGFVMAWAAAGDAELVTVAVVPGARRRGVGASLVAAAGEVARGRGAASMHLEVAEDNEAARALYVKLGYQDVGRRAAYYARTAGAADAIVMRLPLNPDA
jgi:ribosomal-protein-alanine N-acetyltransferase